MDEIGKSIYWKLNGYGHPTSIQRCHENSNRTHPSNQILDQCIVSTINHHRHLLVEMPSSLGLCQTSHPVGGMVYSLQTLKWIIRWIIHWIIQDLLVLAKRHTSIILFRDWMVQLKGLRQLKEIFETEITQYYFHKAKMTKIE